jgi:hypothetical protein
VDVQEVVMECWVKWNGEDRRRGPTLSIVPRERESSRESLLTNKTKDIGQFFFMGKHD